MSSERGAAEAQKIPLVQPTGTETFGKSVLELQLDQVVVILSASRLPIGAEKLFLAEAIDLGVVKVLEER